MLTGRNVEAREALEIGLVSRVVAGDELVTATNELARTIASAPREILMRTKSKIIATAGIDPKLLTLDI